VTAPLPTPVRDGSGLVELLKYVRVEQDGLPALIATLINTMMTHLPQPLVLIQGPAAAGKTTSLRFLLDLIDPSTKMPGGSLTSNERDVRALSRVRRCLVFDKGRDSSREDFI
jgi:Tfp pilus assembly pilus retraction ATPase PilT